MSEETNTGDGQGTNAGSDVAAAQTVDVEKIVKERLARDRRARETEYQGKALQAVSEKLGLELSSFDDLESVRERLEKGQGVESETKSLARKLEKLSNELKTRDEKISQFERRESQRKISEAISAHASSAIRPDQVVRLLSDRFTIGEDGDAIVLDEKGRPTDLAPAKFVADFLAENPHMLRPTAPTGGAASRPGNGKASATGPDLLTPAGRAQAWAELVAKGGLG